MNGDYGHHVSWDMICAQSCWAGLLPPLPIETNSPSDKNKPLLFRNQKLDSNVISRQLHNLCVPFTDDSFKYNCYQKSELDPNATGQYGEL